MSWTYEIALAGPPSAAQSAQAWFAAGPRAACVALKGLSALDLYVNADGPTHDPFNSDGPGPLLLLMLEFHTRDALAAATRAGAIARAVGVVPREISVTGASFERRFYPVGNDSRAAPLEAPFSYVVRYHRPAENEAAFVDNYLATHPATQAGLPGIRSIMCYLPLDALADAGLPAADYMIGNEVVFDTIAAFNTAMASPVRQELRAHFRDFPKFSGAVTHYPMIRSRLAG